MGYIKISWPESQMIMELSEEEMDEYGIEFGDDCSYFVPEEDYDEIYALAEERMRKSIEGDENPEVFVSDLITDCLHTMDDGDDYRFDEPLEMGKRIAIGFYEDDGNEDVRIITLDKEGNRDDLFLSSMPTDIAYQLAKKIDNVEYAYVDMDDRTIEKPWDYFAHSE